MDVASVDVIWNGFHQAKKIADLAETFEVNCAPHNYYSHLATSSLHSGARPSRTHASSSTTSTTCRGATSSSPRFPEISAGELRIPAGPGWGVELNEEVLAEHPWPGPDVRAS